MVNEPVQRKLAAILAADVVGFSSLMERDEEGTYARVGRLRREVIEPREDRVDRLREPYVRVVDELERRGWLQRSVAEHARTPSSALLDPLTGG